MSGFEEQSMPKFSEQFKIEKFGYDSDATFARLVVRYYGPFGTNPPNQQQSELEPPQVTIFGQTEDGQHEPMTPVFTSVEPVPAGQKVPYREGQRDGGYDQYVQIFASGKIRLKDYEQTAIVTGAFQIAAYMSIVLYYDNIQVSRMDRTFSVLDGKSNPYVSGNKSVFAYRPSESESAKPNQTSAQEGADLTLARPGPFRGTPDGHGLVGNHVPLFRPDSTATDRMLEDIAPDGCSAAYLVTNPDADLPEVMLLRIKIPTTFVHDANPDTVFGEYQCRYLSINSNINEYSPPDLDFWTVNSPMMTETQSDEGYGYVFFAPTDYVRDAWNDCGSPAKTPPVIDWGLYRGYLLGPPEYAIILRYRDPNPEWAGSPMNAPCYIADENRPVTRASLGEFTPEIIGGSLEDFVNGSLGGLANDSAWPNVMWRDGCLL